MKLRLDPKDCEQLRKCDFIPRAVGDLEGLRTGVIREDLQCRDNPRLQEDWAAWRGEGQSGGRPFGGWGPQVSRPVR